MLFGRGRKANTPNALDASGGLRVHVAPLVVADPDTWNQKRRRAIALQIGKGLQGYSGQAVGYDRGDPAHSFETVLQAPQSNLPSAALARLGQQADAAPPAQIQDIVMSDPALDSYQALLWNRISR